MYILHVISTLSRHCPDHRQFLCLNWHRKFWTLIHKSCCWPQEDRRKTGRQSNSSPMACNAPGSHTLTRTHGILSYPLGTPLVIASPFCQICNVTIPTTKSCRTEKGLSLLECVQKYYSSNSDHGALTMRKQKRSEQHREWDLQKQRKHDLQKCINLDLYRQFNV